MALTFAPASDFKGKRATNIKRVQIHVAEAQGLSLKGSAKSPSAYVTIESPGLGTLHQTDSAGKGKTLVWHENTRIVELNPTAPIKFTVKRQAFWPIAHNVLGSTDTYDLNKLIEMQGKNDRETCVTLSLNPQMEGTAKPSLVVNIRDLDTPEKIKQVREYAAYAASQQNLHRKGKEIDMASISDNQSSPASSRSSDSFSMTPPMTAASFSSFSTSSPPSSASASTSEEHHSSPLLSPMTAEVVAATSAMSAAVASPASTSHRQRPSSRGKTSSIDETTEVPY